MKIKPVFHCQENGVKMKNPRFADLTGTVPVTKTCRGRGFEMCNNLRKISVENSRFSPPPQPSCL